jgi:hypothetical protein
MNCFLFQSLSMTAGCRNQRVGRSSAFAWLPSSVTCACYSYRIHRTQISSIDSIPSLITRLGSAPWFCAVALALALTLAHRAPPAPKSYIWRPFACLSLQLLADAEEIKPPPVHLCALHVEHWSKYPIVGSEHESSPLPAWAC